MRSLEGFEQVHHVAHFPKPIGYTGGHGRSNFERLMDADEIVVHRMKRDGAGVVLNLL
jgi:hypothetical protein